MADKTPPPTQRAATAGELLAALAESVKLQSHYARLLNRRDGGQRMEFKDANAWIERLRWTGTLPKV